MSGTEFLELTTTAALGLLAVGLAFAFIRLLRGPTLPDRVLALDLFTLLALSFIAVFAIRTGFALYLDIAIALGLVAFLSTVALARYLLQRGRSGGEK
ncbi:MAG TPA: cation:proton antiporter [Devosiaceae bacterium]|jgi:multicomponent Na+:H+ antiporter subunit F|nr:cation:proton antiporter [Devosiaceae bacterium]